MPHSYNQVLRYAQRPIFALETEIPSTIPHAWDMKDHAGGSTPIGCSSDTTVYRNNSSIKLGTDSVVNGRVMPLIISGGTIETTLKDPFEGSGASRNITSFSVINTRTNDPEFNAETDQKLSDLSDRRFKGYNATMKVGGLMYPGTPDEDNIEYADYPILAEGRFTSFSINDESIDLSIESRQDDLKGLFPVSKYEGGQYEGQSKPFGFGNYLEYQCKDLTKGLWQFHDEVFTTDDTEYSKTNYPPFAHFGYGQIFAGTNSGDSLFSLGYLPTPDHALDSSGYTQVDRDEYAYTQTNSKTVVGGGSHPVTVTVDGDDVELVANDDHSFDIKRVEGEGLKTFTQADFNWTKQSSTSSSSIGSAKCVCTTTGDANFELERSTGVRIRANGTGTVSFKFPEKIHKAVMNVRAVRTSVQTVSGWSKEPDSIIPPFHATLPYNNKVALSDIGSDTVSFTYTSSDDSFIMAVWFDSVTTYKPLEAKLKIDFDNTVSEFDFAIDESKGFAINNINASQSSFGSNPTVATITEEGKSFNVDLQADYGSAQIWLDSTLVSDRTYGTFLRDDKLEFVPDPEQTWSGGLVTRGGGCYATLQSKYMSDTKFLFRARIKSGNQDELTIEAGSRDAQTINDDGNSIGQPRIRLGREWKNFEIKSTVTGSSGDLFTEIGLFRAGSVSGNPDEDYSVEVERMTVVETSPIEGSVVGIVTVNNVDVRLPTYRVDDVGHFSDLPVGVCLYDDTGYLKVSEAYRKVRADVDLGSIKSIAAIRRMSVMATGTDHITCDFTGQDVGLVLDKQANWVDHASKICDGLDYYWYENQDTSGITIKQRWALGDDVLGTIPKQRVQSVNRVNSAPRQSQYIVEFAKNYSNKEKTKTAQSQIGYLGEAEPKTIETPLVNRSDAEIIANHIGRDSIENDLWEITLIGIGHGYLVGEAWFIDYHRLPKVTPFVIQKVSEDGESEVMTTRLSVKFHRTD